MATEQRYKIVHTDRTDDSSVNLIEIFDFDIEEGIEASMDSFQFRIMIGVKPTRTIEVNDEIDIYIGEGSSDPSTLIINGIVTELFYDMDVAGIVLTVRGVNRVERLLFSPRPALYDKDFSYTDANDVARTGWDAIITHLIDKANEFKPENDATLITYDTTSVPQLGDLENDYHSDWRSIYEHIETLTTADWTPNGQTYMIELDNTNKLHLRSKDSPDYSDVVGTIDLDGADVISAKITYGLFDVINAVLLNCGKDANGNSILVTKWDVTSMGEYGAKFKYIKEEEIADTYYGRDRGAGKDIETQRNEIRNLGITRVNEILSLLGQPRYKIDATFLGTTKYVRGKVYKVQSSEIAVLGTTEPLKRLRIKNILHRFSARNGWMTSITLEEDEQTIKAYGG